MIQFNTVDVNKELTNNFSIAWEASIEFNGEGDGIAGFNWRLSILGWHKKTTKPIPDGQIGYQDSLNILGEPEMPRDLSNFNFEIYRSFSPQDDFEMIGIVDGDAPQPTYIDADKQCTNNNYRYYKIKAVSKDNPEIYLWSDIKHLGNVTDGILKTIIYRHTLLLKNFSGEPCLILIAKISGAQCPNCWNELKMKPTEHYCETCYGTGFLDGFHKPIRNVEVNIDPSPRISNIKPVDEDQEKGITAWLNNYPLLKPRDIIISEYDNKRYRVVRIDRTQKKLIAVYTRQKSIQPVISRQILSLQEINFNDIEYSESILREEVRVDRGFGTGGFGTGNFMTAVTEGENP